MNDDKLTDSQAVVTEISALTRATSVVVNQIAALTNSTPDDIRSITLEPKSITVEIYERNEAGDKFVHDNGDIATNTRTFPYRYAE